MFTETLCSFASQNAKAYNVSWQVIMMYRIRDVQPCYILGCSLAYDPMFGPEIVFNTHTAEATFPFLSIPTQCCLETSNWRQHIS
jgi:hypothetical protein